MPVWSVFPELMPFGMGSFEELLHIGMGSFQALVPVGMDSGQSGLCLWAWARSILQIWRYSMIWAVPMFANSKGVPKLTPSFVLFMQGMRNRAFICYLERRLIARSCHHRAKSGKEEEFLHDIAADNESPSSTPPLPSVLPPNQKENNKMVEECATWSSSNTTMSIHPAKEYRQ